MNKPTTSALLLGLTLVSASAFSLVGTAGCGDDASKLTKKGGSSSGEPVDDSVDGGELTPAAAQAAAEAQFRALQTDFDRTCGNVCHKAGASGGSPPTFLADPDPYVSVKAFKGAITKQPIQSILWDKAAHTGPALHDSPDLQKKIQNWLIAESVALTVEKKPSTDPITIVNGPNDVDLSPACTAGLTGVHLKFSASLLGTVLSLSDLKVSVPAGTDVHMAHLLLVKKLAAPKADGSDEILDPADSFSNLDIQLPAGVETSIASGLILSGEGFTPFDLATEKVRFQVDKLEPGKVKVAGAATTCKDAAGFATKVLPSMSGQNGVTPNCSSCHNTANAQANINLNQQKGGALDAEFVCSTVLAKTNKADFANSIIIKKVTGMQHAGGQVNNAATWAKLFTDNQAVFY